MDNSSLIIKTKLSNKETFELIEYDNINFFPTKLIIKTSGTLYRKKNENKLDFYETDKENPNDVKLLKINRNYDNGNYSINAGKYSTDLSTLVEQEPAFLVYKCQSNNNESMLSNYKKIYRLNKGDIIKLGRVYIKILDIVLKSKPNQKLCTNKKLEKSYLLKSSTAKQTLNEQKFEKVSFNDINNNNIINFQKSKMNSSIDLLYNRNMGISQNFNFAEEKNDKNNCVLILMNKDKNNNQNNEIEIKKVCRICYVGEVKEEENPLLCPCKCKGSMKYIHYKCLKNWLSSKIESTKGHFFNNGYCITYFQKDLVCELCKTIFPDFIRYKNKLLNITLYDSKFEQYILFESMKVDKFKTKLIHILSLDKYKYFTLGRAQECDIVFPELSVSRYHCNIFKDDNNEIYIEDNHSKFGTLALIQNTNINMIYKKSLRIQKERTYIKIDLNVPLKLFSCCKNVNIMEQKIKPYGLQNKRFLNVDSCFVIKDNIDIEPEQENNNEKIDEKNSDIYIIDNSEKNNEKNTGKNIGNNSIKIVRIRSIQNNHENDIIQKNQFNSSNNLISIKLHENINKNEDSNKREKKINYKDVSKKFLRRCNSSGSFSSTYNKREASKFGHLIGSSSIFFRNRFDSCNNVRKIKLKKPRSIKNRINYK